MYSNRALGTRGPFTVPNIRGELIDGAKVAVMTSTLTVLTKFNKQNYQSGGELDMENFEDAILIFTLKYTTTGFTLQVDGDPIYNEYRNLYLTLTSTFTATPTSLPILPNDSNLKTNVIYIGERYKVYTNVDLPIYIVPMESRYYNIWDAGVGRQMGKPNYGRFAFWSTKLTSPNYNTAIVITPYGKCAKGGTGGYLTTADAGCIFALEADVMKPAPFFYNYCSKVKECGTDCFGKCNNGNTCSFNSAITASYPYSCGVITPPPPPGGGGDNEDDEKDKEVIEKKPWYTLWWIWVAVGVAVLLVVIVVIFLMMKSNKAPTPTIVVKS